jgi:polar amino acid transport system substrate-binding protein
VAATREPFSFVDENGEVTGHDGELARRFAVRLNRPVEFLNMKFMALIPALQSGKVDLIVTGMTGTDERSKFVDFSEPYFANEQRMLVRRGADGAGEGERAAGHGDAISSLDQLDGRRITVLSGSAGDLAETAGSPGTSAARPIAARRNGRIGNGFMLLLRWSGARSFPDVDQVARHRHRTII